MVKWIGTLFRRPSINENRNKLIVQVVKNNPERTFLILVKRIKQGEWLAKEIEKNVLIMWIVY